MKLLPITSQRTVDLCKNFLNSSPPSLPTIFISSYPKSGTTWTQAIVYGLLTKGKFNELNHISDYAPFFEIDGTWEADRALVKERYSQNHEQIGCRIFNTHLRREMMPQITKESRSKCIYLVREGKDVCTSFFHHLTNQLDGGGFKWKVNATEEEAFEEFFRLWVNGDIPFGSWAHHLKSWLGSSAPNLVDDDCVLVMKYEDMLTNLEDCVKQMSKFLEVNLTDLELQALLPQLNFQCMSEHREKFEPISVSFRNEYKFLRKGITGDSNSLFTENEKQKFLEMLEFEFPNVRHHWFYELRYYF